MIAEGLDQVINDFTRASVRVKLGAVEAVKRVASKIEQSAKSLAPEGSRDHGGQDLSDSIHVSLSGSMAEIGPSARHGAFVEYGTYKDAPQPYLWPAYGKHASELVSEFERLGGDI